MGKIKKISENELVGGTQTTDIYPVTSVKAVYDENNERLDHILNRRGVVNISTNYNADHTAEVLTLNQAIAKVPSKDRVLGFQGKYLASDGWHTVVYTGESLTTWSNNNNWIDLADKVFNSISKNATFAGIATPTTNPGVPDGPVFYLATKEGAYSNFDGIEVAHGEAVILIWNNSAWYKKITGLATKELLDELRSDITNILSIYSTPYKTSNQSWIGDNGTPIPVNPTARIFFYKVNAGTKINLVLSGITGPHDATIYHYAFYNSEEYNSSTFMAQYSFIRKYRENFIGQIIVPEGAVLIGISVDLSDTNDICIIKNLNKEINDNTTKVTKIEEKVTELNAANIATAEKVTELSDSLILSNAALTSIYSSPFKTSNNAWIGNDGNPAPINPTARIFFYKVNKDDKICLSLGKITGPPSNNYYHYGFYNSETPDSSTFMAQYSFIRKNGEDFMGQIVVPEGAVLIGISVDINNTNNDIGVLKNLNKEINDNANKIEAYRDANLFPLFTGKVLYSNAILGQKYPEYYPDNSLSSQNPNGCTLNNISYFSSINNAELINDDKFGQVFRMKSSDTAYSGDVTRFTTNTILVTLNLHDDKYPFILESIAYNGGWFRINLITGEKSIQYDKINADIISRVGSVVTLKLYYVDETIAAISFRLLRIDKTKNPATDYYDIINAVGYPNKNIRVHDKVSSYYSLYQSSWVNKNIMIMGDSNTPMQFVAWARHMLGTNVYSNWHGGYSMRRTAKTENNWLYKHDRQLFIKNLIKTNNIVCSAYVFFVSYNDGDGGGVLTDEAIQAVLDNYPTMDDDVSEDTNSDYYKKMNGGVLSSGTVVKGWNNLTSEEAKEIFGYKQVMAALIRQIYSLYSDREQIETPYIFLTTIMYSIAGNTDAGELAERERKARQSINNDINELSNWFGGIPVIDVNKGTGYALNIQSVHATDVHFSTVIKSRLGKFVCSEILKYQMGDDLIN